MSDIGIEDIAAPRRITLKEIGAPDVVTQPLQVRYPDLDANFELKTGLINLLPRFHGLPGEDPIKHLKDFQVVCTTARRHGADGDAVKVFAFPFSLEGKAKEWFYTLPDAIVVSWDLFKKAFLEQYFPPSRTNRIRKEISGITQMTGETFHEY